MKCNICGARSKIYKNLDTLGKHLEDFHGESLGASVNPAITSEHIKKMRRQAKIANIITWIFYVFYAILAIAAIKYILS